MLRRALTIPFIILNLIKFLVLAEDSLELVCQKIESSVSSATQVAYPGLLSTQYYEDMAHWASSSSQPSKCSVRPGNTDDLSAIIRILGSTRTPFAVKGGGHTTNQGFSSTKGVLISMSKFSQVTYDPVSQTVILGAGLTWDDAYAALAPYGVTVVGGRLTGTGVAGLSLGGGYSYLTNQYGLVLDNIVAYELVKPDGTVAQITGETDPELVFGLKGGFNNFGIVTKFTMKTHPQGRIWGGTVWYPLLALPDVSKAIEAFSTEVVDLKANVAAVYHPIDDLIPLGSVGYNFLKQVLDLPPSSGIFVSMFYDAPQPPAGLFDRFLKIPHLYEDMGTHDYHSWIRHYPTNLTFGARITFDTVPIKRYSVKILDAIRNETEFWGARLSGRAINLYFVEPFPPSILSHNPTSTAWPPDRSTAYTPFEMVFLWLDPSMDDEIYEAARLSADQIRRVAIEDGQDSTNAPSYPNYAIHDTPLERLYGRNLPRLKALKEKIDPENVMGLAGGWKF